MLILCYLVEAPGPLAGRATVLVERESHVKAAETGRSVREGKCMVTEI